MQLLTTTTATIKDFLCTKLQPRHNPPTKDGILLQIELKHACQSPTPDDLTTIQAAVANEIIVNIKEMLPRIPIINQDNFIFSLITVTKIMLTNRHFLCFIQSEHYCP